MSRGGQRSGSGRKPDGRASAVLVDLERARIPHRAAPLPPAISADERTELLEPPAGIPAAVATCWRDLAPKALERHTLTPVETPGFLELCRRLAYVQTLDARIAVLGAGTHEALPLLRERRALGALLLAALKDFKLSAFGKPVTTDVPKPVANPWQQLTGS